jgi:hypothetical protein
MKRCHECGRKFGLIRHRWGLHQFCTNSCLQRYKNRFLEKGRNWCLLFVEAYPNMSALKIARFGSSGRRGSGKRRI